MYAGRAVKILLVLGVILLRSAFGENADFKSIFNGRDLSGWEGDPKFWSVRDGVLRGETTLGKLALSNTFCIWRGGLLKDFELKLKFRIQNGNSGIQYRSKDLGKFSVAGYQAEIENHQGKVGFLYEEKGRKYLVNVGERVTVDGRGERRVTGMIAPQAEYISKGYYKDRDWNEYRIIAKGNYVTQYLNGFQTIELTDDDAKKRALEGVLALQIHAGPPMLVEFKDILLKKL
jgi:hypothetical protein